jgi:integrase/recombinase XerC
MSHALAVVSPASPLAPLAGADIFAAWLAGKDALTVAAYRRDLETFRAYLAPHTVSDFLAADAGPAHAMAHGYRAALVAQGLAPATINRKLSALRSVVTFARMVGAVAWTLELPGVESAKYRDTRGPGVAGFRAMLAGFTGRTDAKAARDVAVVRLCFDVALRRAEVVSLDREHFDADAGTLAVLGKKRRERERLTLPAPTRAALAAWLAVRGGAPGPLFTNFDRAGKGARLTGRSVARIVAAAADAAGLGTVRPHGLRHAAITHALDVAGGDVRRVARFSRHRDLRTLTIYDDARTDLAGEVAALVAGAA